MGSFSIWHWLIVLLIVVMVFGTKKLKNIGSDLGGAVKGFKDGLKEGEASASSSSATTQPPQVTQNSQNSQKAEQTTIDVEAKQK